MELRLRRAGVVLALLMLVWVFGRALLPLPLTAERAFACAETCGDGGVVVVTARRCRCGGRR